MSFRQTMRGLHQRTPQQTCLQLHRATMGLLRNCHVMSAGEADATCIPIQREAGLSRFRTHRMVVRETRKFAVCCVVSHLQWSSVSLVGSESHTLAVAVPLSMPRLAYRRLDMRKGSRRCLF